MYVSIFISCYNYYIFISNYVRFYYFFPKIFNFGRLTLWGISCEPTSDREESEYDVWRHLANIRVTREHPPFISYVSLFFLTLSLSFTFSVFFCISLTRFLSEGAAFDDTPFSVPFGVWDLARFFSNREFETGDTLILFIPPSGILWR